MTHNSSTATFRGGGRWRGSRGSGGHDKGDANNQLYAIEAVIDYDPSKDLEKIRVRLLAINFAGDELIRRSV